MYRGVAELASVRFCFGAELLMAIWVHVYPNGGHGWSSAKNIGLSNTSVHYRAGSGSERIGLWLSSQTDKMSGQILVKSKSPSPRPTSILIKVNKGAKSSARPLTQSTSLTKLTATLASLVIADRFIRSVQYEN